LGATPAEALDQTSIDERARAIAEVFADEEFCFLIPPRPLSGIFAPEPAMALALARDHALARALETPLRRAAAWPIVTLAPSYPFDAAVVRVTEPILSRILADVLWLYADYWQAARSVVVTGTADALPPLGLSPLRNACAPAVVLFVFTADDGSIAGAGYVSLLTGRLLAAWLPSGSGPD
jgi:hypothetical protein